MSALIKNLPKPLSQCNPSKGNRGLGFLIEADCTDLLSKVTALNSCLVLNEPENDIAFTIPLPNKPIPTTINEEQVDTSNIFLAIPCNIESPRTLLDPQENLIILE